MKLSLNLLFLMFFTICNSQTTNFVYEYSSIPDSTAKNNVLKELMVLTVSKNKSEFYSLNQFKNDSITESSISKGFPPPPQSLTDKNYRVIKEIPNKNKVNFIASISSTTYDVPQVLNFDWKLTQESKIIMNYNVQKATTNYGGRTWIAWFTKEIPIQDGPYKFCNLPGLILKIEDSKQNHIYEIKAITKSPKDFIYPENKYISAIKVDYPKFSKLYKKYRKEPIADIMDKIQDVKDSNGYVVTTKSQIIKEIEESSLKELEKDNNLIELDLLKQ